MCFIYIYIYNVFQQQQGMRTRELFFGLLSKRSQQGCFTEKEPAINNPEIM